MINDKPKTIDELPELATPTQVRAVLNLSDYEMRVLIREKKIGHVPIGSRFLIPRESVRQFILDNTVQPCRHETTGRVYATSTSAVASTSSGLRVGAAASAARARQIVNKLKSPLRASSKSEGK